MDLVAFPTEFPQFGKSLRSLGRTKGEIFIRGSRLSGNRGNSATESCGCSGSREGSGCGCSSCEEPVCKRSTSGDETFNTFGSRPRHWLGTTASGGAPSAEWTAHAWHVIAEIYRNGHYRGSDFGCGEMTMIVADGIYAKRCDDLGNMMETADCAANKATCPVESGVVWLCGMPLAFKCACFNVWYVMPEGKRKGTPGGSFGLWTPTEDMPASDDDLKKHGGCSWMKTNTCACHCWFGNTPPDYPRGEMGRNTPCDRLGKKGAGDYSRASNEVYPSPFNWKK